MIRVRVNHHDAVETIIVMVVHFMLLITSILCQYYVA